ncbi:hypothetical protein GQ55_5G187000 [Panicum hallii var. hallii]|uniref:Secreted protein n=1 Tax=Panicum hallii var. hallii TaxID=1504633 RepID=A0A2T7DHS6_9POAL|nr:hypothetical protein GQ55_5G187000 [Panicum hallii var. hallii]
MFPDIAVLACFFPFLPRACSVPHNWYSEQVFLPWNTFNPEPNSQVQSDRRGGWWLQLTCMKSHPPTRICGEHPFFSPKLAEETAAAKVARQCSCVKFRQPKLFWIRGGAGGSSLFGSGYMTFQDQSVNLAA